MVTRWATVGIVLHWRARLSFMHALKARVVNGRYVIDEPADLPEGAEIELVVMGRGMSAEERSALVKAIDEAEQDIEAGRVVARDTPSGVGLAA